MFFVQVSTKINKKHKKSDFSGEKSPNFLKFANVFLTFKPFDKVFNNAISY